MTAADRIIRWTTAGAVVGVAAVAAVASYEHAYALVRAHFEIVGTAILALAQPGSSYSERIRFAFSGIWHEARLANTFTLYLFLFATLAVEAIILFM
jgi:hypothetical protein